MNKTRIGIDMDDVICDFHGHVFDWCAERFDLDPIHKYKTHTTTLLTPDQKRERTALLNEGHVFREFEAKEGAIEVIERLNRAYDVFIITAAMEHPSSLKPKFDWMQTHMPFMDPLKLVFCGVKYVANVDYLIDDTPDHFEHLDGEGILFSAPKNLEETRYKRVDTWADVAQMFL